MNFILKTFSMCVQRTYLQSIFYIVVYSYFFPSKKENKYLIHPTCSRVSHSKLQAVLEFKVYRTSDESITYLTFRM